MKNKSLFLAVFFALSLVIIRIYFTKSIFYPFLIWNLFLAYIPLIISKLIIFNDSKLTTAILLPIWLLFLPNAPYIVTDLLHLIHNKSAMSIWYDALLITTFAIIGMYYFYQSIYILQNYFKAFIQDKIIWFLIVITLFLSSFGVYLGRFLRWNSWDILHQPKNVINDILIRFSNPMQHPRTWLVTLGFGLLFLLGYVMYRWKNKYLHI